LTYGSSQASPTVDLRIARDAANTLAQRNLANAQTFRIYNTTDSGLANYERAKIAWESNVLVIGTEAGGTGSTRNIAFQIGGTTKLDYGISLANYWNYFSDTSSKTGISVSNNNSAGASAFAAYKNGNTNFGCEFGYWNSTRTAYGIIVADSGYIYANTNNGFNITNDNGPIVFGTASGFGPVERLRISSTGIISFGGTTSSFPAIKRNGTALNFRLADDSADAPITAGNATFSGALTAATKSFLIDHPSKPDYTLEYGSLESPYHGVRLTGKASISSNSVKVELPDYIKDLVHSDEVNIQITNYKHGHTLWVEDIDIENNCFTVSCGDNIYRACEFFWSFTATRRDVPRITVEKPKWA